MTDAAYDRLRIKLRELEGSLDPSFDPNTHEKLGDAPSDKFQRAQHEVPMLSIDNVYTLDELSVWLDKLRASHPDAPLMIQPKLDGIALALHYVDGKLVKAITRGDGLVGDDVTKNAYMLQNIPIYLSDKQEHIEVRGEVVIPFDEFARVNTRFTENEKPYSNPRNLASGTMKSHDPFDVVDRGLEFIAYGFGKIAPSCGLRSVSGSMEAFAQLVGDSYASSCISTYVHIPSISSRSNKEICSLLDELNKQRTHLPYQTDGCVVKVDSFDIQAQLGHGSKYVKWAVAVKLNKKLTTTKLVKIDWQTGMSGKITPRATLEPRELDGTVVTAAGVHNEAIVAALGLYDGCTVAIEKAGEIIPQIVECCNPSTTSPRGSCAAPTTCASCGEKLVTVINETTNQLYCQNKTCPAIVRGKIEHFVAREQMDIPGFGEGTILDLINFRVLKDVGDLYHLKDWQDVLASKPGYGKKSVDKLLEAIEASKGAGLHKVLAGLGLPRLGNKVCTQLAEMYVTLDNLLQAKQTDLVNAFGPKTVESIISELLDNSDTQKLLTKLRAAGVSMVYDEPKKKSTANTPVTNKRVCITGVLSEPRSKIMAELVRRGAIEQGTLNKTTDILIVGDDAGSKLDKAKNLGVAIKDEKWLQQLFKEYP